MDVGGDCTVSGKVHHGCVDLRPFAMFEYRPIPSLREIATTSAWGVLERDKMLCTLSGCTVDATYRTFFD